MLMKKVIIILMLICSMNAFAASQKPLISVFDFKGDSVSEQELLLFVDFLTSEIVATEKYTLIDRMQRETILAEIEFSLTGCTDESCQLEAGKLLQANEIVMGSIGVFGEKTLLNMKLIEVETGATLSSVSQQYDSFNDVIVDNHRLVNLLLKDTSPAVADGQSEAPAEKTVIPTSYDLFRQTDEMINDDLSANFQLIQNNAKQLSPEERNALYDANERNAVTGVLLNIIPGFGVGSFVNDDTGTGAMQLMLDIVGTAAVATYFVDYAVASAWIDSHMEYWVPDPNGTDDVYGEYGNFYINGSIYYPRKDWPIYVGVGGLIIYGASRIVSSLIAGSYGSFNEDLGSALNLSK